MKKVLSILLVSLFALALVLLAVYGFRQYRDQKVGRILVHIERKGNRGFLDGKELKAIIRKKNPVVGKPLKQVNVSQIEKTVSANPYVKEADAFLNLFGDLMVNVTERTALLRVYNRQNKSCYVDEEGNLFPLSTSFAPRVLPANGYIKAKFDMGSNVFDKKYRHTSLPVLFLLARKIVGNPFLRANTSQLFVNSRGDVDLFPELGRYVIHFGDSSEMNVKLENLEAFCKQVFAHGGWSKYRSIHLEFTNQIVCTKK